MRAPLFDGTQPCAQTDPEVFFPVKGGSPAAAKRVCSGCEFLQPCLDYALTTRIEGIAIDGVWGGTTARERSDIQNRPKRGRATAASCGTASGAKAHRRRGEETCDSCREALRVYNREANYRRSDRRRPARAAA